MSDPDPRYTLLLTNHQSREHLKIELFDLPFPGARSYDSHLPLLTLWASSMSHRFPRAPFAFGSMASGRGRSPWRAKRWWQSDFAAGSSGTNENRRSVSPSGRFGLATEVPARNAGLLLENRERVLAFRESRYSRCASHSQAATGGGATKQRDASTQRGGYRTSDRN
jgi:hypothetical protein